MANVLIFISICSIASALVIDIYQRIDTQKTISQIKSLHDENMRLYGRMCYMRGYQDGIENNEFDFEKINEEYNE